MEETMTDPVTVAGGTDPVATQPTDEELHAAAVDAITAVVTRKWAGASPEGIREMATGVLDLSLEMGDQGAVVLVPGHRPDAWRLADAVRRTGTSYCSVCPNKPPVYDGTPAGQDLKAAEQVIRHLMTRGPGS